MTSALSPELNAYGKYARRSAIADFLELLALGGKSISRARLGDYIDDADWRFDELVIDPGGAETSTGTEDPQDVADQVFAVMRERDEILGPRYPIQVGERTAVRKTEFGDDEAPYVAVLGVAFAHAYGLSPPNRPYEVFEETVSRVLRRGDVRAVNLAGGVRQSGRFDEALQKACEEVGLRAVPTAALRLKYARDEKVDSLCHLPWGDHRPGAWAMLGQATCSKSEEWDKKLAEVPAVGWMKRLGVQVRPWVFLAIPHHAESGFLAKLVQDRESIVLDRLRLVRYMSSVSEAERALARFVRGLDLEPV